MNYLPVETVIHPDEKAWEITELDRVVPGLPGYRRIQSLYVIRGDEMAVLERDLGDARSFTAPEFRCLSFMVHTAGELWDMADFNRDRDEWFRQRLREIDGESTLTADWLKFLEERYKRVRNQSQFGPGGAIQRNGFSLAGAQTALADMRSR